MSNFNWREQRFGNRIPDDLTEPVLTIGKDVFTYQDILDKLRTRRVVAARILDKNLKRFKPESVEELAGRITVNDLFKCEGVGMTTLYVWLNVLTYHNIDIDNWLNNEHSASKMYNDRPRKKRRRPRRARW